MTIPLPPSDIEPPHAESPTASLLTNLQLYGHGRPGDEPDPRPFPTDARLQGALADIFDALVATFAQTPLEADLDPLLWSTVNLFHRAGERIDRQLDTNEEAQKRSQSEQDGSEVRSVELERLIIQGSGLIERRDHFEAMREIAADLYEAHLGQAWRPRSGSRVNRKTLTAAMIDSRDFLNARRRAETEVLLPPGPKIAFTGGPECNDHRGIWAALDRVRAKHPAMALLHGGSPKGAERIAACWADSRKVAQVLFKPDWVRHKKAAPFRRNDTLLEVMPIGIVAFPGSGICDNLVDKARTIGIPVLDFRKGGGA